MPPLMFTLPPSSLSNSLSRFRRKTEFIKPSASSIPPNPLPFTPNPNHSYAAGVVLCKRKGYGSTSSAEKNVYVQLLQLVLTRHTFTFMDPLFSTLFSSLAPLTPHPTPGQGRSRLREKGEEREGWHV